MRFLVAAVVVAPAVLLVVSSIRGRVRVQSCCSVPADQDARLRNAVAESRSSTSSGSAS